MIIKGIPQYTALWKHNFGKQTIVMISLFKHIKTPSCAIDALYFGLDYAEYDQFVHIFFQFTNLKLDWQTTSRLEVQGKIASNILIAKNHG